MTEERPHERPSMTAAFGAAAQRSGLGTVRPGETPTAGALLAAVGGVRGLVESILPGLAFLVAYTFTGELLPSVLIPLGVGVVFVVVRLLQRSAVIPAIAGLLGIGVSAALALLTGDVNDNFVPGLLTNIAFLILAIVSVVARRPIIGIIVGLLAQDSHWRSDAAKLRVASVATWVWAGLFAARLAVQGPLYLAGATSALAATKLLMGVPLYAGVLWVIWLLIRSAWGRGAAGSTPS
jgi:hypothetical protein